MIIGSSEKDNPCIFGKELTIDASWCCKMPDMYIKDKDKNCKISIACPIRNTINLAKVEGKYLIPMVISYSKENGL